MHEPGLPRLRERSHGDLTMPARSGPTKPRALRCSTYKARFFERQGYPRATRCSAPDCPLARRLRSWRVWPNGLAPARTHSWSGGGIRTPSSDEPEGGGKPTDATTSWWFSPATNEVQFDEEWDFVERKQKNCAPDANRRGDCWTMWLWAQRAGCWSVRWSVSGPRARPTRWAVISTGGLGEGPAADDNQMSIRYTGQPSGTRAVSG